MKHIIFSENCFYVQFKAPNHKELKEFVFSKEEKYTEFDWSEDCDVKTISCSWQETIDLLKPSLCEFSKSIGKRFKYDVHDPWINCYKKNGFQEIHDHIKCDLSCVFFPEVQENFGKFYFYNRYANSLNSSWARLIGNTSTWYPDIRSGDIIFFPSTILHGVSPHKSDTIRKTFSCNFSFDLPD